MPPVLLLSPLTSLLSALTHPSGAPHTALLCSLPAGGAVVASASTPTEAPFPPPALGSGDDGEGDGEGDGDEDERARCYAALAVGSWTDHQREGGAGGRKEGEPVMLETELGRIALAPLDNFLLVLVGNEVAPWKVLDKKIRSAVDRLEEPLKKVAA